MVELELRNRTHGERKDGLRRGNAIALSLFILAAALCVAGCGDFWQDPYTSTSTTTSTGTTASTTTLVSSSATATVNGTVTLTATVSPSAATGTVTFYNGTTSIGSATLASGTATDLVTLTSAGQESFTATYSGDSTYASSTSSPVTVTVSAATSSSVAASNAAATSSVAASKPGVPADGSSSAGWKQAAAIQTSSAFSATGKSYTAGNGEAAVIEGDGAVNLTGTALSGAAGNGSGVLLYQSSAGAGNSSFSMTGGSLAYNCTAALTPGCTQNSASAGDTNPATLFFVAGATAAISLTDVQVSNNTAAAANPYGTLLTAGTLNAGATGTAAPSGGNVDFTAQGTALTGNVNLDSASTAALSLLEDNSKTGSTLAGAINSANTGGGVTLTLDPASLWIVTGTSYVTSLTGLDLSNTTVNNIYGGGHCVYYSGSINGAAGSTVYSLGGGGYLAPVGTSGLNCN